MYDNIKKMKNHKTYVCQKCKPIFFFYQRVSSQQLVKKQLNCFLTFNLKKIYKYV